jgi:hypothetical protein
MARAASGRRVGPAFVPGFLFVISSKMPQLPRRPSLVRCTAARLHDFVIRASQRYARAYFVGLNDVRSHNNPAATERSYPSHSLTNFYSALTTYRPCPVGDFKIAAPQMFARHAPIKKFSSTVIRRALNSTCRFCVVDQTLANASMVSTVSTMQRFYDT